VQDADGHGSLLAYRVLYIARAAMNTAEHRLMEVPI
jgi:hypothetical protein